VNDNVFMQHGGLRTVKAISFCGIERGRRLVMITVDGWYGREAPPKPTQRDRLRAVILQASGWLNSIGRSIE
jgi:hypothetical protein